MTTRSSLSMLFVAASVLSISIGCAAPSTEESDNEPSESQGAAVTRITSGPESTRCGSGTCTETSGSSCEGFRDKCKAQSGCGTTSTGAGDIAIVSCVAIPPPPRN